MNGIRLQLLLAKAGIASRRHAEVLISQGHVAVNGRVVTQLGTRVDPATDRISVDGKLVEQEPLAYYLLNKPKGYVTTASDPDGRQTVFDLIPDAPVRLFAVGRLDYNTEGVLLLTNDGELAHALMHPSRGVPKVYHAKFREELTPMMIARLKEGVDLPPPRPMGRDGQPLPVPAHHGMPERSAPAEVRVLKFTSRHTWAELRIHEGKNRQIHRMAEAVGSSLLKLVRVEYAGLSADNVEVGAYRPLRSQEVAKLRQMCGLSPTAVRSAQLEERTRSSQRSRPEHSSRPETRGQERPAPRRFEERPAPKRFEERPAAPKRFEERPAPKRFDDRPAPKRFDDRPPAPKRFEERPAPRRFEERPAAPKRFDDRPPAPRRFDDRPAPKRFDERPAPRRFEERPAAPKRFDDRPPAPKRFDDRPAPKRFDDRPAPRRFDDRPAPRRFDDRPAPRRFDERPAPRRFDERQQKPGGRQPAGPRDRYDHATPPAE
ncbi:MAG: pseudouridine synthase [Myxococcales bacterium]|nr:pseudouridine synthase [Myxococcales bacterium]